MKRFNLSIPGLILISATRAALGAGAGLLLGGRMMPNKRLAAGWSLFGVGVVTTIPIIAQLMGLERRGRRLRHRREDLHAHRARRTRARMRSNSSTN